MLTASVMKELTNKKEALHLSFEVLNKIKKKKEKEEIAFKECCLVKSG